MERLNRRLDASMFDRLLRQDLTMMGHSQTYLLRNDGQIIPALITFRPVTSSGDLVFGITVTDLVASESQEQFASVVEPLRANEERYRTLFNSIDEGFCVVEVLYDEQDTPIDYRFVEVNAIFEKQTGLCNATGKRMRIPGVVVNITDRRLTEQRLEQVAANLSEADRRKDEFLATLAHELRNPLSPIKIAAQLMQMAQDDPVQLRELSGVIDRQVNQMVRLIDDLMDVSRISRGKLKLQTLTCDLRDVVANALEAAQPFIHASGQTLHFIDAREAMLVEGDPARLTQVLVNLLNNSAKYTPAAGEIWLTARREGDEAILSVRDNGAGLLRSQLEQIFEMFEQIDISKERGQAGLGIGLSLVKTLVELHGGTVTAISEGQGCGCDFQVRLPLSADQRAPQDVDDDLPIDTAPSGSFRILVVEDTRAIRYMLVRLLQTMGHVVEEATNGKEGIEKAISFEPEVILSDISMPEMNGHEFAKSIREIESFKHVVMVALTGFGQNADREHALQCGFDDYMTKPADARLLSRFFERLATKLIVD